MSRDLDALLAEEVMGFKPMSDPGLFWDNNQKRTRLIRGSDLCKARHAKFPDFKREDEHGFIFSPTTDPAAALEAAEKARQKGRTFKLVQHGKGDWSAYLNGHQGLPCDTPAAAICAVIKCHLDHEAEMMHNSDG